MPEQIRWIVLLLQLRQTLVVGTEGCPDLVCAVFFLAPDVIDVDPAGGVGLQGLPQLPGPADMSLRFPRVQPLGGEDQVIEGVAVGVGGVAPPHGAPTLLEERYG